MRRNALELNPRVTLLLVGLTAALWIGSATPTQAHGAKIEVLPQAVEIIATFDTGEPMDNAQVAVYAPDTPGTPWRTGQTDGEGRFSFVPNTGPDDGIPDDGVINGLWEVTVRKAGHGQTTTFALGEETGMQATATQSAAQKWLSMAAIIWGFVGTALYFSNRDRKGKAYKGRGYSRSTTQPAVGLDSAQTADNRATVAAGIGNDRKATAKESR